MNTTKNNEKKDQDFDLELAMENDAFFEEPTEPIPRSSSWRRIEMLKEKKRLREQLGSIDNFELD